MNVSLQRVNRILFERSICVQRNSHGITKELMSFLIAGVASQHKLHPQKLKRKYCDLLTLIISFQAHTLCLPPKQPGCVVRHYCCGKADDNTMRRKKCMQRGGGDGISQLHIFAWQ